MRVTEKHLLSGGIAALIACATSVTCLVAVLSSPKTASAEVVDFDDDIGLYDTWDGVTYDFSWYGDGSAKSYEISTAAQLASLSILTNDLSSEEWNSVTANVSEGDKQFIGTVDDFAGKTITVTSDIDLADHDWTPISYPWRTANLSSTYEFMNLNGELVTYNAVDYVPELETVDPWVGDENGNPISTRYWEFPESEMRFRDLIRPINFDKMNELVDESIKYNRPLAYKNSETIYYAGDVENRWSYTTVKPRDYDWDILRSYTYKDIRGFTEIPAFSGVIDGNNHRIKGLSPDTPWTDNSDERLRTYDPIAKAFVSQLDEDGQITSLNIQGSYDDEIMSYSSILCAYNYGNISVCCVDSKNISQSLITMTYPIRREYSPNRDSVYAYSETPGTVMPVGNSGILTSQNYGTITGCVTNGSVTQAYRQFGGVACSNYGTIDTCTNYADISSKDIQTDFTTDEWSYSDMYEGVPVYVYPRVLGDHSEWIMFVSGGLERYANKFGDASDNCITPLHTVYNVYTPSSESEYTKQYHLEPANLPVAITTNHTGLSYYLNWDDTLIYACSGLRYPFGSYADHSDISNNILSGFLDRSHLVTSGGIPDGNAFPLISEGTQDYWISLNEHVSGSVQDLLLWLPELYRTEEGESIAANHLYGNYVMAAVGGICATNDGYLVDCVNNGSIEALRNITEQTAHSRYGVTESDAKDRMSYIRPTNAYGIFSTAVNTVSYASGITVLNTGDISGCSNNADITYPEEYSESVDDTTYQKILDKNTSQYGISNEFDFIPATRNNYYQNGVLVGDKVTDTDSCALYGHGWWITEEWLDEHTENGLVMTSASHRDADGHMVSPTAYDIGTYFDRNMPYPFTARYNAKRIGVTSGIVCMNTGSVHDLNTVGTAQDSVISVSDGMDKAIDVYNITTTSPSRTFRNMTNTAMDNVVSTGAKSFAVNLLQKGDVFVESNNIYITDTEDELAEIVCIRGDDKDLFVFNKVSFKKTDEQVGAPLAKTITRATFNELINQSSWGSPGLLDTVNITGYYVADSNGIKKLFEGKDSVLKDTYVNIASAEMMCDLTGSTVENLRVYSNGSTPVGEMLNCDISDVQIFGNDATMTCDGCNINQFMSIGNIAADTYATHNSIDIADIDNFVYYFKDCTAKDMYLESEIDYTLVGLNQAGFSYNIVPGVVSIINSTDKFEHCSINAPDGVLSYKYPNHLILDEVDKSYGIIYSDHAARDGAMAYALTSNDRQFTVARHDVRNQRDTWQEFGLSELLDRCQFAVDSIDLPAYTRERESDSEDVYHKISVPYVSYGLGELTASHEVEGEIYSTHATGEIFPHTDVFVTNGENITLSIEAADHYALNGVTEYIDEKERKIPSEGIEDEPYKITQYLAGDKDVTLVGDWVGVHDIEVDDSVSDIIDIIPNASAAAKNQRITVNGIVKDDAWSVGSFYYMCYKKDASNRQVLDTDSKMVIEADGKFVMPDAPVKIYADLLNNKTSIDKFVISGQDAVISGNNVDVYFDNSIDISNLTVEDYLISDKAVISPDPYSVHDFSSPVVFTVTSESGLYSTQFVVTAHPIVDGTIEKFQILGYNGIIDGTNITITVPNSLDISSVRPHIIWSGVYLKPDSTHVFDFNNALTFEVGASDGSVTTYTVTTNKTDEAIAPLQEFELENVIVDIDHASRRIKISYPYGMDVSNLTLDRVSYMGASSSIESGMTINLTHGNKLSIVDIGGNVVSYDIIATEMDPEMAGILQFNLFGRNAIIDETNLTITLDLPDYVDKSNVAPYVLTFLGKELSPSATVKQDFSSPVQYTVTSYTGETKTYTVTIV